MQSSRYTILFMVVLSFVCAVILATLASALARPQDVAKELYRSKQMLVAAQLYNQDLENFTTQDPSGQTVPARFEKGKLLPTDKIIRATQEQILELYRLRFEPLLVDNKGDITTFKKTGLDQNHYLNSNRKTGYYRLPYKLIYAIYNDGPESTARQIDGYIIPINGYGLWDAIYGYLALKPDGVTVIGISWYDHKETPGLGAEIASGAWQRQFPGKKIVQESADGAIDVQKNPIGLVVVKGRVSEVLGESPKAKSAVDGIAGSTLTGNGVTEAYRDVLQAYRPFFIKVQEKSRSLLWQSPSHQSRPT